MFSILLIRLQLSIKLHKTHLIPSFFYFCLLKNICHFLMNIFLSFYFFNFPLFLFLLRYTVVFNHSSLYFKGNFFHLSLFPKFIHRFLNVCNVFCDFLSSIVTFYWYLLDHFQIEILVFSCLVVLTSCCYLSYYLAPYYFFLYNNFAWNLTLSLFCCLFLYEINFAKLLKWGGVQESFSNIVELALLPFVKCSEIG